jgi:hypothetical protein
VRTRLGNRDRFGDTARPLDRPIRGVQERPNSTGLGDTIITESATYDDQPPRRQSPKRFVAEHGKMGPDPFEKFPSSLIFSHSCHDPRPAICAGPCSQRARQNQRNREILTAPHMSARAFIDQKWCSIADLSGRSPLDTAVLQRLNILQTGPTRVMIESRECGFPGAPHLGC